MFHSTEVIAKNFQVDINAFDHLPSRELYIFPCEPFTIPVPSIHFSFVLIIIAAPPPDNIQDDMVIPNNTPEPYTFALSKVIPTKLEGGSVKVVDSRTFKVSKTIAAAEVTVEVGGMR